MSRRNEFTPRFLFGTPKYFEGTAERLRMPLLVCVAEQGAGRGSAECHRHRSAGAPGVELIIYSVRHFDVFTGHTRRQLLQDQVALTVPVAGRLSDVVVK